MSHVCPAVWSIGSVDTVLTLFENLCASCRMAAQNLPKSVRAAPASDLTLGPLSV